MGITNSFAKFLIHVKNSGVNFDQTLTLGRLRLYTQLSSLKEAAKKLSVPLDFSSTEGKPYSEDFFKILGADTLHSMDYSDYEQAEIIHDLNIPVPANLHKKYSLVVDSGTLEHVFNFPVAIKSCMDLLKVNGTFVGITPANNMMGHGFYQFSPELFYRIFSEENGFKVLHMMVGILNSNGEVEKWYEVKDPAWVKARVTLRNFKETFLFVAAMKTADVPVLQSNPFQSDYLATWEKAKHTNEDIPLVKKIYKEMVPEQTKEYVGKIRNYFFKPQKMKDTSIGVIDTTHFIEVDL